VTGYHYGGLPNLLCGQDDHKLEAPMIDMDFMDDKRGPPGISCGMDCEVDFP
jgi:hypothetical protein